ncbi:hypothetical protein RDWZM_000948 [Blomia tropicalis]|uniref:Timeless N-terminal domain-containing protein n=1 Tax=Blomia tropicalis TaxID=40697 RepID=A0A9Q0MBX2_BLOTA|nr:hypothetical protein RDWZM_000948 [Blomia tropicalis]
MNDSIPTDGPYDDEDNEDEVEEVEGTSMQLNNGIFQADEEDLVLCSQVVTVLNELGHYNRLTKTYQLNHRDASSCLRDLIRFLRNDGIKFLVRRQMGMSNIVSNDLMPIVEQHTVNIDNGSINEQSKSIMDKTVRLLVDLTNPTMLHYKNQAIPKDNKHEVQIYMGLQETLFKYKISFATQKRFWIVLAKHLTRILELDDTNRQVEDGLMFERIIVLIRNVLHIPAVSDKSALDDDTTVQDKIIEQMYHSGILDILQYMMQTDEYNDYCFHLAEILHLLFREQNAEFLAKSVEDDPLASRHLDAETRESLLANSGRSMFERECDRKEIADARSRDRQKSEELMAKYRSNVSRFARPTFVVKNMKSISDRDMICHQLYTNPEVEIDLNKNKSTKARPRNRRPMQDSADNSDAYGVARIHRTNRKLRLILNEFCCKFLSECFNTFMNTVRTNLYRGTASEHDETYYVWAIQFFLEFSRCRIKATAEERYNQISELISTSTFHYLQKLVDDYLDHLAAKGIFKNELVDWSKRLHGVLRSYRELLFTMASIDRLQLPEASKMCHRVKQDIFTEPEYREMLLRLIQAYNEEAMSKAYLRDLIETNHVFLRMLDYHAKISYDFKIKIKKKKKRTKKQKPKQKSDVQEDEGVCVDEQELETVEEDDPNVNTDELWIDILDQVSTVLHSESFLSEKSVIAEYEDLRELFDPLSESSLEDKKLCAMRRICQFLRNRKIELAVRLFREVRFTMAGLEDENAFGEIGISVDDELLALNEIMMVDFPKLEIKKKKKEAGKVKDDEKENLEEDDDDEVDEEEEENSKQHYQEANFSIEDTTRRYAHPKVLQAYRFLLNTYRQNTALTNHAIVRMFHRIAYDLKMASMFFNFSFFLIFERILSDPMSKLTGTSGKPLTDGSYKATVQELGQFSLFITKKFFKLVKKFPRIVVELCFQANSRDAYAMEYGFDDATVASMLKEKKKKSLWTDAQELELDVLYKEWIEKATKEKDVVDLIQENLIDDSKTRRQIMKKLKEMGLMEAGTKSNKYKGSPWSEVEIAELEELYDRFKDQTDFSTLSNNPANLTTTVEIADPKEDDICEEIHLFQRMSKKCLTLQRRKNIYDHSLANKWTHELIDELRTIFCNLYVDYNEWKNYLTISKINDELEDEDNEINVNNKSASIEPEEFKFNEKLTDKLGERFKSKSWKQIIRQLKKMGFEDSLKTLQLIKDSSNKSKNKNDDQLNEVDNSSDDDSDDNDDSDEEDEDNYTKLRSSPNKNNQKEQVIVQYESDNDGADDANRRTSIDLSEIINDEHDLDMSDIENNVHESFNNPPSIHNEMDLSPSKQKKKDNAKRLEQLRQSMLNIDSDDDDDDTIRSPNQIVRKKRRTLIIERDEIDDDDVIEHSEMNNEQIESLANKRKHIEDSDDERDGEDHEKDVSINVTKKKRIVFDDSD